MILLINMIMRKAPEYNKTGLVGFPINVILNWPMATTAGFAAFLNDKVITTNRCLIILMLHENQSKNPFIINLKNEHYNFFARICIVSRLPPSGR